MPKTKTRTRTIIAVALVTLSIVGIVAGFTIVIKRNGGTIGTIVNRSGSVVTKKPAPKPALVPPVADGQNTSTISVTNAIEDAKPARTGHINIEDQQVTVQQAGNFI